MFEFNNIFEKGAFLEKNKKQAASSLISCSHAHQKLFEEDNEDLLMNSKLYNTKNITLDQKNSCFYLDKDGIKTNNIFEIFNMQLTQSEESIFGRKDFLNKREKLSFESKV
jgi:hypothetical protein